MSSLGAMITAMADKTRLNICSMEDVGQHYIRTLILWREALMSQRRQVMALRFDPAFLRKWDYYFCNCEAE